MIHLGKHLNLVNLIGAVTSGVTGLSGMYYNNNTQIKQY